MITETKYKVYLAPRVFGVGPVDSNILLIGESPGNDETIFMQPFVGYSGKLLNDCLGRNGISRESIRIENLSNHRPHNDKFENLLNTPFLEHGLQSIHQHILTYRPVVIGALGNYPMHYLTGKGRLTKGKVSGIGNWRGSILPYVDNQGIVHDDIKVVPTFHPAAVARERSLYPIFDADIKRIKQESKFRGLRYKERNIIINPVGFELIQEVKKILDYGLITVDIETIRGSTIILSISFSTSSSDALVLDSTSLTNLQYIAKILASDIRKVFHFGYFDTTQLKLNGMQIGIDVDSIKLNRPYFYDTYLAAHVIEPELPKTLAYETSIRTREPYYKQEGKEDADQKGWSKKVDRERLFRYNGKDTCCTFEVFLSQLEDLRDHDLFNFEMSMIEVQTHISNSGMLIDPKRLELLKSALIARWAKLQYILDGVAGFEVNVRSPLLAKWLYDELKLPAKHAQNKITTNDAALVSLLNHTKTKENESVRSDTKRKYKTQGNIIRAIREIREIRQRLSMYVDSKQSTDGRTRSTYKYGPETGRMASSKYVDGTGYNHQTNPRDPIVVPDEEFEKYSKEIKYLDQLEEEHKEREKEDESSSE